MVFLRIGDLARTSVCFMEICMAHVEFRTMNPNMVVIVIPLEASITTSRLLLLSAEIF